MRLRWRAARTALGPIGLLNPAGLSLKPRSSAIDGLKAIHVKRVVPSKDHPRGEDDSKVRSVTDTRLHGPIMSSTLPKPARKNKKGSGVNSTKNTIATGPIRAGTRPVSSDIVQIDGIPKSKTESYTGKFGRFFLRENCQCSKCIHPDTKQRTADTFAIPQDVKVESVKREQHLEVSWSDGHLGHYPYSWLHAHAQWEFGIQLDAVPEKPEPPLDAPGPRAFREIMTSDMSPRVSYDAVMSDDHWVSNWLQLIYNRGFCFVDGVPVTPEATQALIERISFIRHTHYGGFWDFTADLTFKDTAYTNESLGAHTDNTYFTDPARLQLFHLLSHTDGSGGENTLVDGFAAAAQLRAENPAHYDQLVKHRHPWHASGNEDSCIQPSAQAPVFAIHPDFGKMYQIRWNNYDRAPKTNWTAQEQESWYSAARHYNKILQSKEIKQTLQPGSALIFDNWRMLHGRTEFTGKRRMCGGYVNNDDFVSRLRILKWGRKRVLKNLGNMRLNSDSPYSII